MDEVRDCRNILYYVLSAKGQSIKSYWGMVWTELDDQQRETRSVDGSALLCGMKDVAVIPRDRK